MLRFREAVQDSIKVVLTLARPGQQAALAARTGPKG